MIVDELKWALRNLLRNKLFAVVNLFSLSMAMMIGLFVISLVGELQTFDNFHRNGERVFRVISTLHFPSRDNSARATCPVPVADALKANYKELGTVTRIHKLFRGSGLVNRKEIPISGYFTDPEFFDVFTFSFVSSNAEMLSRPNTLVLTSALAQKFFGQRDPVGESMQVSGLGEFMIVGVIEDPPRNSHLDFEALASLSSLQPLESTGIENPTLTNWSEFVRTYAYVRLADGVSEQALSEALGHIEPLANQHYEQATLNLELQPLDAIVPGPDLSSEIGKKMGYLPLFIMVMVVLLILGSACINYANLSLALSLRRAREVGLRKIMGSSHRQLFIKFLSETMLLSTLALAVAMLIFYSLRTEILSLVPAAGRMVSLAFHPWLLVSFIGLAVLTGWMAGTVPALVLTRLPVISSLKGIIAKDAFGRISLRKALIVFQFTLSLFLIIGITTIYRQYRYSMTKDLGFERENILVVPLKSVRYATFKPLMVQHPFIASVSASSEPIGSHLTQSAWFSMPGMEDSTMVNYMEVDDAFVRQLGMVMIAGQAFHADSPSNEIIVNERFALAANLSPDDLVGGEVRIQSTPYTVKGVVKDFHYQHLEEAIRPFYFVRNAEAARYAYLSLDAKAWPEHNEALASSWKQVSADESFEPMLLVDRLGDTYRFYTDFMKIFGFIALLAVSIGSLGLLGMTLYAAEVRTREMGIRKVMGAGDASLLFLLSRSFIVLLLIACGLAVPVGYFAFTELVSLSAYHISVGIVELGAGIALFLGLGAVIIVAQTMKTVKANPAEVLRAVD